MDPVPEAYAQRLRALRAEPSRDVAPMESSNTSGVKIIR